MSADRPPSEFRWQSFFRRSSDALFLLDRRRRLLFVNRPWEALTGLSFGEVRGLACTGRRPVTPSAREAVARTLRPPPEVMRGQTVHIRRTGLDEATAWDIDFLPLSDGDRVLGVMGRIVADVAVQRIRVALPESLLALRRDRARRHGLEMMESAVPSVRRAAEQARVAAQVNACVLIVGEAGSGRQWLARAVHHLGPRGELAFAALDCGRLPPRTLEQSLFGGGGLLGRPGVGAVYLRDVDRLPRDLQGRLLEALDEEGPRVIAGSASDLSAEVRSLRVLEELRCRLATLVIEVPPLRERRADLPRLAESFLKRAEARPIPVLSPEALQVLSGYGWPGNLRELFEVLSAAAGRATAGWIGAAELPMPIRLASGAERVPDRGERPLPMATLLEEAERRLIQLALRQAKGNKTRAAELLGIWKPLLYRRMAALGLKDD